MAGCGLKPLQGALNCSHGVNDIKVSVSCELRWALNCRVPNVPSMLFKVLVRLGHVGRPGPVDLHDGRDIVSPRWQPICGLCPEPASFALDQIRKSRRIPAAFRHFISLSAGLIENDFHGAYTGRAWVQLRCACAAAMSCELQSHFVA